MRQLQSYQQTWTSLCLLLLILLIPVSLIVKFGSSNMNMLDTSTRSQAVAQAITTITSQLQIIANERFQKLSSVMERRVKQDDTWQNQLRQKLNKKIADNSWVTSISNHKRVHILNILMDQRSFQGEAEPVYTMIKRGLLWFSNEYHLNLSIVNWNQAINLGQIIAPTVIVNMQELKYGYLQQNIANRLRRGQYRNEYYIRDVVRELRSTPLFSHCQYTNLACELTTFVMISTTKEESYTKVEDQVYFIQQTEPQILYHVLAEYLGLYELESLRESSNASSDQLAEIHRLLLAESYLTETSKILNYLNFTFHPIQNLWQKMQQKWKQSPQKLLDFLKKGQYLSPYFHNRQEDQLIQKLMSCIEEFKNYKTVNLRLDQDPMTDFRVGKIDLFPNDFKLGVYLPLIIMFIYPLLIKLKDILITAFALIFKQKTAATPIPDDVSKPHQE